MSEQPEELEELEEMHDELEPMEAAGGGAAPDRGQEKAPQLLKQASKLLLVGSLLPWIGSPAPLVDGLIPKAILLVAAFVFHQGVVAACGGKPVGGIDALAKIRLAPGKDGLIGALNVAHLVGVIVMGVGLYMAIALGGKYMSEPVSLLLATFTLSHIFGYEQGGKFNPLFPLMFMGAALGGLLALISNAANQAWLGALGAAIVGAAGILACYTIVVAMMQAKKEGDAKRAAALEARKAARRQRRAQQS